jgi:hypothetical protein
MIKRFFLARMMILEFALGIAFAPAGALAQRAVPEDHIRYPVLVTLENGYVASGFYVNNEAGEAFFVTARHILFEKDAAENYVPKAAKLLLLSYPRETNLNHPIYLELQLDLLFEKGFAMVHATQDVAAVHIGGVTQTGPLRSLELVEGVTQKVAEGESGNGTLLGASPSVIKRYEDVTVGNDVFIFGYPVSLGIENYPQLDYLKPLLRRGSIAGKNDEKMTIILDCPTMYGNSGGPVIEVEETSLTQTNYWVIGLVSEFIPFQDKWYGADAPPPFRGIENSGYSVVIPMDTVLDLIQSKKAA